jgi:hypothetical protein
MLMCRMRWLAVWIAGSKPGNDELKVAGGKT